MKILSLERLSGPGRSVDENFELLILALMNAPMESKACYRISAPDRGIDILNPEDGVAMQCKAYSSFRGDLLNAVKSSVQRANAAQDQLRWESYGLAIPFVPTAKQREALENVLK